MSGPDAAAARHEDLRRGGVIWLAYAFAARRLVRLLGPVLVVVLPVGLLSAAALVLVADDPALALVNGGFALIGTPERPLLVWSAATLAVTAAGHLVALPATVVLAAGLLAGRPVSTGVALRRAVRRAHATLALVLIGMLVVAAVVVAGFVTVAVTQEVSVAYAVMAFLALPAMPFFLAVPGVVLERLPASDAIARAYRMTGEAFGASVFTLAFGVVIFPAVAIGPAPVLALAAVPFQAAVIARLFLHRLVSSRTRAAFEEFVDGLPEGEPGPARPVPVLTALLLPGLLYGGAVRANPLGLVQVSETVLARLPEGDLEITHADLRALYAGRDGRMIMLMDGDSGQAKLLTCADSGCAEPRLSRAEPAAVAGGYVSVGARLADGRLALTTWAIDPMYQEVWDEDWTARLGIVLCDAKACVPSPGEPLGKVREGDANRVLAMAARPGGGLLLAQLRPIPWGEDTYKEVLTITACDDPACARRRTREVTKLTVDPDTLDMRALVADVDAGDRPVILGLDRETGSLVVIACDDPTCERKTIERPVDSHYSAYEPRAALAIRPDGRPLIAYRVNSTIRLLDCRTRTCAQADTIEVTGRRPQAGLALTLTPDGRALVAFQDLGHEQVFLASCTETRCAPAPVTRIPRGGGHGLTMTLDSHGRPVLAWIDSAERHPVKSEWSLVVTTVAER